MVYLNFNKLKEEIEEKREVLNNLFIIGTDENILVNYSAELDKLIYKYHNIQLNKMKMKN